MGKIRGNRFTMDERAIRAEKNEVHGKNTDSKKKTEGQSLVLKTRATSEKGIGLRACSQENRKRKQVVRREFR